jgi:hypothetical protein
MEPALLSEHFGQSQLRERLSELEPKKDVSDISSLRDIFCLIPRSHIEVVVFASDPLSGTRRAIRGFLIPGCSEDPP